MDYETLPKYHNGDNGFLYMVEVYVNDFMSLVIPVSREQLQHVAAAIDPISEKKTKGSGRPVFNMQDTSGV